MKDYFNATRAASERPATISFRQIVVTPKPSARPRPDPEQPTRSCWRSSGRRLRHAARGSRRTGLQGPGGELNWFRRGVMVPEFERVAFALNRDHLRPGRDPLRVSTSSSRAHPAGRGAGRHILLVPALDTSNMHKPRPRHQDPRTGPAGCLVRTRLQRDLSRSSSERNGGRTCPRDMLPSPTPKVFGMADRHGGAGVAPCGCGGLRHVQWCSLRWRGALPGRIFATAYVKDHLRQQLRAELSIRR
jgi:hypothetical protein